MSAEAPIVFQGITQGILPSIKIEQDICNIQSTKLKAKYNSLCYCQVTSVVSDSVRPQRRQPTRPCDSPGKNTGVGGIDK